MHSGIKPYLNRVLVQPDEIEEVTKGGIIIADSIAERHQSAQSIGVLVAMGPDAYREYSSVTERLIDGTWKPVERTVTSYSMEGIPKIGDRVAFAKYGGKQVWGADGVEYRLMNDLDITAEVNDEVNFTDIASRKAVGVR